jgi:hypothetical protein
VAVRRHDPKVFVTLPVAGQWTCLLLY